MRRIIPVLLVAAVLLASCKKENMVNFTEADWVEASLVLVVPYYSQGTLVRSYIPLNDLDFTDVIAPEDADYDGYSLSTAYIGIVSGPCDENGKWLSGDKNPKHFKVPDFHSTGSGRVLYNDLDGCGWKPEFADYNPLTVELLYDDGRGHSINVGTTFRVHKRPVPIVLHRGERDPRDPDIIAFNHATDASDIYQVKIVYNKYPGNWFQYGHAVPYISGEGDSFSVRTDTNFSSFCSKTESKTPVSGGYDYTLTVRRSAASPGAASRLHFNCVCDGVTSSRVFNVHDSALGLVDPGGKEVKETQSFGKGFETHYYAKDFQTGQIHSFGQSELVCQNDDSFFDADKEEWWGWISKAISTDSNWVLKIGKPGSDVAGNGKPLTFSPVGRKARISLVLKDKELEGYDGGHSPDINTSYFKQTFTVNVID